MTLVLSYLLLGLVLGFTTYWSTKNADLTRQITPTFSGQVVQWSWLLWVFTHWLGGNLMANAFNGCVIHRRRYTAFVMVGWPLITIFLVGMTIAFVARTLWTKVFPNGIGLTRTCACGHCAVAK